MRLQLLLAMPMLVLAACAGAPPTVPAVAPPVISAPTAAATPDEQARQKILADARGEGYVPSVHNGTTLYCKTDSSTGTHIPHLVCLTEDQMVDQMRLLAKNRSDWATNRTCGNVACSGFMPTGH